MTASTRLVVALGLLALTAAACGQGRTTAAPEVTEPAAAPEATEEPAGGSAVDTGPIQIGVPQTLTGPASNFGKADQVAFELAVDDINAAGGITTLNGEPRPLELVYTDMRGETERAISAAQKIISVDESLMILGGDTSATCQVIAKEAQDAKVPYLMHVCLADTITQQGWDYVFRIPPPLSEGMVGLQDFLTTVVQPDKVDVVYEQTVYGEGIEGSFRSWAEEEGIGFASQSFTVGGLDHRALLNQVRGEEPDFILFATYLADAITLTKQAEELQLEPQLFGGTAGVLYDEWSDAVGDAALYYVSPSFGAADVAYPGSQEYWDRYQEVSGNAATFSQAGAYASVFVVKDALERTELTGDLAADRTALRDALAETDLMTVYGPIKFETFGEYTNQTRLPTVVVQYLPGDGGGDPGWSTVWPEDLAASDYVFPVPGDG